MAEVKVKIGADSTDFSNTIRGVEQQLRSMRREFAGADVGSARFNELKQSIGQTEAHLGTLRGGFAKLSGRGRGSIGDAALQMAYFVDDVQYGVRGIVNNIPLLLMSLGAGTGLTGVISIAAVAASQLWQRLGPANDRLEKTKTAADAAKAAHESLRQEIQNESEAFDSLSERIEGSFDVMNEMSRLNEAQGDREFARKIKAVETDDTLSDEEKANEIKYLKDVQAEKKAQAKINTELSAMEERQAKAQAARESLQQAANRAQQIKVNQKLGLEARNLIEENLPRMKGELSEAEAFYLRPFADLDPKRQLQELARSDPDAAGRIQGLRDRVATAQSQLERLPAGDSEAARERFQTAFKAVEQAAQRLNNLERSNYFENQVSRARMDAAPMEASDRMQQNHEEMVEVLKNIQKNTRSGGAATFQ